MATQIGPIVVTGAGGFIGRRVVRKLIESGYSVRALVHRPPSQAFDAAVHVSVGDVTHPETYAALLNGAYAVVHAALTDDLTADVAVTPALQQSSVEAGVQKLVHLSSIAVYGSRSSGVITEQMQPLESPDRYSRAKLAIEEALRADCAIGETVILRLGCVYGPGKGWWTDGLLNLMQRGKLIAINDGSGIANLIHVDDVGAMVLLTLRHSGSSLDIFNVTGGVPVTWRQYFSALEDILGRRATVSMSEAEARRYSQVWLQPSLVRRAVRRLRGRRFIYPLDGRAIANYASSAIFSNEKARTIGFKPEYDLESGLQTITRCPTRK